MSILGNRLFESRSWMRQCARPDGPHQLEAEGGCGVVGVASSVQLPGRHILQPLVQMHNRGNGKGGGIAAVGLSGDQMGVSQKVLENDYLIQVAYLKPEVRNSLEDEFIKPNYKVDKKYEVETSDDKSFLSSLEVRPPEVWRYFCRVKPDALAKFVAGNNLQNLDPRKAEDEMVYQTSFKINHKYYVSSQMAAFVMSHGRNMIVMKIVGYAEEVIKYYKLEDLKAHVWIGHQRYPTKGRVWHPGGAHPFVGLDEALVHNGDFANYHSVSEYLAQRNVVPLFLTDTEVSVLLFDVLNRGYSYPLEYIIEALAPTTERDFTLLPEQKREVYRAIQATHIHGSPDGPWFFIIGRNAFYEKRFQLMGITDTSMLRPQVFALVDGEVQLGLIASEKQAIDSLLRSISEDHESVPGYADMYWNARGGSHTDGGALIFSLFSEEDAPAGKRLICTNKFGTVVAPQHVGWSAEDDLSLAGELPAKPKNDRLCKELAEIKGPTVAFNWFLSRLQDMTGKELANLLAFISQQSGASDTAADDTVELLTMIIDKRYSSGRFRRSRLVDKATEALVRALRKAPRMEKEARSRYSLVDVKNRDKLREASSPYDRLVIDCEGFPMEGVQGVSFLIKSSREFGWNRILLLGAHGQRFIGCGLGPKSKGLRVDVYGSPGDYLASGLDGAEIVVHSNGQDQLGQIMADGKLVVHGDVGQTFLFGAKGGEAYILGHAAGMRL